MNKQNSDLQAFIGHLVDIYKIATFDFRNPHSYTKFRNIKSMQRKTVANTFIETGTYLGVTTKRCSPIFKKVYTIELDQNLAQQASNYLSNNDNVEVIQGNAIAVLPDLLENKDINDALVFLDGHFSGGETACGDEPEPAVAELEILANYQHKIKCIIVDDFRTFGSDPNFPKKSELIKAVEEHFRDYDIIVHLDQLIIAKKS